MNVEYDESIQVAASRWLYLKKSMLLSKQDEVLFEAWCEHPKHAAAYKQASSLDWALTQIADRPAMASLRERVLAKKALTQTSQPEQEGSPTYPADNISDIRDFAEKSRLVLRPKWISVASVAIAASLAFFFVLPYWLNNYTSEPGQIRTLVLQDATKVILDSGSKIRVSYGEEERLVYLLKGRAYFDVAKAVDRPFSVQAQNARITAIGTMFSVDSQQDLVEVLLQEGKLITTSVGDKNGQTKLELSAGERSVITKDGTNQKDYIGKMDHLLSWTVGVYSFKSERLQDILDVVNRYSDNSIIVDDEEIATQKVDAVFEVGQSGSFVHGLSEVMGYEYKIDRSGNILIFDGDK